MDLYIKVIKECFYQHQVHSVVKTYPKKSSSSAFADARFPVYYRLKQKVIKKSFTDTKFTVP